MRSIWLNVRNRAGYLIATAVFWIALFATASQSLLDPALRPNIILLFILMLCSFAAVLLINHSLPRNFLIIALLIGIFTVAAQRFFCPIDEEYHFLRAFDLTNGRILPADAGGWVPAGYDEYATRYGWSFSEMLQCPSLWLSEIKELEFVYHIRAASYLPFSYIPLGNRHRHCQNLSASASWDIIFRAPVELSVLCRHMYLGNMAYENAAFLDISGGPVHRSVCAYGRYLHRQSVDLLRAFVCFHLPALLL